MSEVARFTIDYIQYLDENGQALTTLPPLANNPDALINMYRTMTLMRAHDTKAIALQRTGKMGTYASILGQEAISTVIGYVMKPEDVLVPFYRDYAAQVQRGVDMADIYTYWGGDERGSCFKNNKEDLPISVPIASQCLHAAGIAAAFTIRKQPRVALVSCGDGGTSEGDFYEAMNVAGVWNLPMVFVVNNNQWAISVPRTKQTHSATIAQKAIAAGFTGIQVDGNDTLALHEVLSNSLEKARAGKGPTLIEALTYRLCDHTTADDASRYRPKEELEQAWKKEPLIRLRQFLIQKDYWDASKEEALQAECKVQVEETTKRYLEQSPPTLDSTFDYHYAKLPDSLKEQKKEALEGWNHA
jgi:2-oxoisovalerate dehydrogenase E1 component alpha subunit